MKFSSFAILFTGFFACLFIIFATKVDKTTLASQASNEYKQMLITACYDAVSQFDMSEEYLMDSESERITILNAFHKSLSTNFNTFDDSKTSEQIPLYAPVVCLVDYNGFYISHNQIYNDANNYELYSTICTPLQTWTWTTNNNNYIYQFNLDDTLTVYKHIGTNSVYTGTYQEIYNIGKDTFTGIDFCKDYDSFIAKRNSVIIETTNEIIEESINEYNSLYTSDQHQYSFTMPTITTDDWGKMLNGPTVIGFIQGKYLTNYEKDINLYALAGAKIVETTKYAVNTIDGVKYYHESDCVLNGANSEYFNSKQECALQGANPCPECQ